MRNPVRPAPVPPDKPGQNFKMQRSSTQVNKWEEFTSDDPFFMPNVNRPKSVPLERLAAKKKPPPRPPPPKFAQKPQQQKSSSLLMNLFSRQPSSRKPIAAHSTESQTKSVCKETSSPTVTGSLINLNSPPSSPSPTSHSSSDGVSVNSFGSDCTKPSTTGTSNTPSSLGPHNHTSFFESGFEDDFNFFASSSSSNKTPDPQDPWSINYPQDPFSPLPVATPPTLTQKIVELPKPSLSSRPTIIRAKTTKPLRPPDPTMALLKGVFDEASALHTNSNFDDYSDCSLPMPSIPPPPLPPEVLQELEKCPEVPPRPKQRQMDSLKKPYGIALYDYAASHPDDLSFQTNDVVILLRQISADWLYGQVHGREGMFPANFVNVMVPLESDQSQTSMVTALYSFSPETWDDLEFPEGAAIRVLGRVSKDWLYGEYGGKSGQFPSSFVDHIPPDLPQRRT